MHICLMTCTTLEHAVKGGMEHHAAALCEGLVARGHRITILTTRHPDGKTEITGRGIRTLFLPYAADRAYSVRWWRESARAFARLHAADPVDIVWSQGIGAYGYLRLPARERAVPCVAIFHGTPAGDWRGMRRLWGISVGKAYRLARFTLRTAIFGRMFRLTAHRAADVICVSPQLAADVVRELGVAEDKVVVVPNGVDAAKFRPDNAQRRALRARFGISDDEFTLLTAGRLEQAKGHQYALRTAAILAEQGIAVRVLVAGGGPDEAWLREQADLLGLADRVHWLGHVPRDQMPGVYNAADAVLMLSAHTEAFPYAVVEAMSCGLPVVASQVGGIPAAISDGQDGFLVATGDTNEAVERVLALLRDGERRAALGRAARETVLRRFTLDRMVADTEAVFLRHAVGRGAQT